jgi:hypothetical protein
MDCWKVEGRELKRQFWVNEKSVEFWVLGFGLKTANNKNQ